MGFLNLFQRHKPKIKVASTKTDGFSGWIKCTKCQEMIHANELEENLSCCPKCDHHYRLSPKKRIELLCEAESFHELFGDIAPTDPLTFSDTLPYPERIEKAQEKTSSLEAILTGTARIGQFKVAIGVFDFAFLGGSMGSVVGEKITKLAEYALFHRLPFILVPASGGARMQESIFSLMQMAKTSAAIARLDAAGIPFISILTNPTTGGVTASFATLGDVLLAEPDALIAFTGPKVVEQTIRQKLPKTAQRSEFLLEKGMIDLIVNRKDLKEKVLLFLDFFSSNKTSDHKTSQDLLTDLHKIASKQRKKNVVEVGQNNA